MGGYITRLAICKRQRTLFQIAGHNAWEHVHSLLLRLAGEGYRYFWLH